MASFRLARFKLMIDDLKAIKGVRMSPVLLRLIGLVVLVVSIPLHTWIGATMSL